MKKVILSIVFIFVSVFSYSQVYKVSVNSMAIFQHDFEYETNDVIGTDKMEVLGGNEYIKPWEITYDLSSMTWFSKLEINNENGDEVEIQKGMITNVNETNAILNINVVSDVGQSYHVLIDVSRDNESVDVIYVRRQIFIDGKSYIKGWTSNDISVKKS